MHLINYYLIAHLKVRAARGEHDFVGLQLTALRGKRDVHQRPIVQQRGADGYKIWLVIVPAQTELLHRHCQRRRQRLRKQQQ